MDGMLGSVTTAFKYQYSNLPLHVTAEFCEGKTFIVTGANIGLGFEAAKHLVRQRSHRVILAVRSRSRGEEALAAIESETGVRGVAQVWQLDLSSYDSVLAFADRVERELDRVDAIIENAGAANKDWILCEGWESTIMVNILGTILLAVLLMPHLAGCGNKFGIKPRIVIVTSGLAWTRQVDLAKIGNGEILRDVNDSAKWTVDGMNRYSMSKLLQVFACRQLASLAPASRIGVVINIVDPGLCKTGFTRYADLGTKVMMSVLRTIMGQSAEWGSRSLLHGVAVGEESHGKYLTYCEIKEDWVPEWVSNEDGQKWSQRMWEEVAAEFERVRPGCVSRALSA